MDPFVPLNRKQPSFWVRHSEALELLLWMIAGVLGGAVAFLVLDGVESWLR
jgi:hypothetical protein